MHDGAKREIRQKSGRLINKNGGYLPTIFRATAWHDDCLGLRGKLSPCVRRTIFYQW
jgi:hypothetical protein